ncbi:MAG: DPP IV N-terminal domain-containing protein [Gemmatimonadaceae bacterium]
MTGADYTRAERYLSRNTTPRVTGGAVRATWLPDGRFWYRNAVEGGHEFVIVDPTRRTRTSAFDARRLATALSTVADTSFDPLQLPLTQLEMSAAEKNIAFDIGSRRYRCDLQAYRCASEQTSLPAVPRNMHPSPDGKRAAFIRDWNLWMRDLASGQEKQLTTDGVRDFGYATDNAGWIRSDRAILLWSPDSRRIATFQQDDRNVGEMYLVSTTVGHPRLDAWKYPLPGDSVVAMIHRVIIDVDAGRVVRLQMPPDYHRSTTCDHIACDGPLLADARWSPDGSRLAFVSSSRDHKHAQLRVADAATGAVRDVLEERVATYYESGSDGENWSVLWSTNEVLWFSERDNWGHLYLHDLSTGALKSRVTSGEGNVAQVLRVDERSRTLWFVGVGRERGRDPYFRHVYRAGLDGRTVRLLTPENADHSVTLSPSGSHFVDSWSRPDVPPRSALRDMNGRVVLQLETTDISRLVATGWTPPIPFTVKARDGTTDLYGLMYRPASFDSTRSYPIIVHHYPGPQGGSVGSRSFSPSRGDTRAIAELGFVVIQLDGMGLPGRSKSFHDAFYGNMGDNGLPDQITGVRQLAQRHRWIDLDRVGIYGHSGGGYSAADAILRYPEFFTVAVSQAGNHDNRNYEDDWAEKWQGLLVRNPDGTTNYDNQANQLLAKNLRGKLLIAYGTMDDNVPPYNSLVLINELIRHNKDFDVIPFPNRRHGFGNEPYMTRRRWDYFVEHLLGAEPPREFEFRALTAPAVSVLPSSGPQPDP